MNAETATAPSGSANSSGSSGRRSNIGYRSCDYSLVVVQRVLISVSILLGYDLISVPQGPQMRLLRALNRILRNFYFITKAVRKWLAINYNDGVIPEPAVVRGVRSFRVARSTPMDSMLSSHLAGSPKHSPIDRRYTEPARDYDLATALKERHNRSQQGNNTSELRYFYAESHSSDFLRHSSLSFRQLLNGLAQSFVGNIEDPDEEMNRKEERQEEADSHRKGQGTSADGQAPQREEHKSRGEDTTEEESSSMQTQNESENRRRNEMVVESVLDHDAEQLKQQNMMMNGNEDGAATSSSTDSNGGRRGPLPVPNFDDTRSPDTSSEL